MAITVKHKFVSAIPDGTDATVVRPSNWNDDHDLAGLGTIAEQNANAVAITGGTVSGTTFTSDTVSNNLDFTPTTAPAYTEGRVWYDSTEKALAFYNDSSALAVHLSQDLIFKVINNTGSTIPNGSPVYVTGTSSGQTYPNVALARADVASTASVIGLTNGAIANGGIGYVTSQGTIDNVNTGTFTVGQVLYLSPYSAGQLMNTIPPTGITVQVGVVTFVNSTTGHIYVKQTTPLAVPASIITGTLGVANGGTGATTLTGLVLGNGTSAMTAVTAPSGTVVGTTDTQTLTNKRINPRISSATSTATLTVNSDSFDQAVLTAQAVALSVAAPTGTPVNGQKLIIRIEDNATAQTISWTTTSGGFRVIGCTLPTTTVSTKTVYVGCIYNSDETFWDVVSVGQQI
jgi:hypothetical protein